MNRVRKNLLQTQIHKIHSLSATGAHRLIRQRRAVSRAPAMLCGLLLSVVLSTGVTGHAYAETAYISDELTVPLRSGPSGRHRILHAGLPSGTVLEIISVDEEAGFTQIRTQRGSEGWVRTQYLVSEPIARTKLAQAQRRIAQLENAVAEARARIDELTQTNAAQQSTNQAESARVAELEAELARITEISASAVATHEENMQLKDTNARLKDELDDVAEARNALAENEGNQGMMLGAGFILIGLLAGVLIKARPQRSAWS